MTMSKDFVAASTTPLVLSILSQGDSYGYSIIKQVSQLSGGQMVWADGMLYPILHRLEHKGLIESYWGQADNGRKRKYYRLQAAGKKELVQQRSNLGKLQAMLEQLDRGQACLT